MLYSEYMDKVKQIALLTNEVTGLTYIRPDFRYILDGIGIDIDEVSDFDSATDDIVMEQLILERDMRNAMKDKTVLVANWIYDVINTVVDPAVNETQDKLLKDMIEYRKTKNAMDAKAKELDQKEQELADASKIVPLNFGFDFAKRTP